MKINASIKDGDIRIDVEEFLSSLSPEAIRSLANQEAFRDRVVWCVARLLVSGEF